MHWTPNHACTVKNPGWVLWCFFSTLSTTSGASCRSALLWGILFVPNAVDVDLRCYAWWQFSKLASTLVSLPHGCAVFFQRQCLLINGQHRARNMKKAQHVGQSLSARSKQCHVCHNQATPLHCLEVNVLGKNTRWKRIDQWTHQPRMYTHWAKDHVLVPSTTSSKKGENQETCCANQAHLRIKQQKKILTLECHCGN